MIKEIKEGCIGEEVRILSRSFGLEEKTMCDKELVWSIRVFQKSSGLIDDGIFGFYSWLKYFERLKKGDRSIQKQDYVNFGKLLDCEPELIESIIQVETKGIGFIEPQKPISKEKSGIMSWGVMLIPEDKYMLCGVDSLNEFICEINKGEYNQLSLGISYLKNLGILKKLDFKKIAYCLCGSSFVRELYDIRLKRAYYKLKRANYPKK